MDIDKKILTEKQNLEYYAAINFSKFAQNILKIDFKIEQLVEPPLPDLICLYNGEKVGLEIAHLFGSERDARQLLGRSQEKELLMKNRVEHSRLSLKEKIIFDLNSIFFEKSKKKYPIRTILLIRNAYPQWGKADFQSYRNVIQIPKEHNFIEIWLLCGKDTSTDLIQYYPEEKVY